LLNGELIIYDGSCIFWGGFVSEFDAVLSSGAWSFDNDGRTLEKPLKQETRDSWINKARRVELLPPKRPLNIPSEVRTL
jgi:hypothetical protein